MNHRIMIPSLVFTVMLLSAGLFAGETYTLELKYEKDQVIKQRVTTHVVTESLSMPGGKMSVEHSYILVRTVDKVRKDGLVEVLARGESAVMKRNNEEVNKFLTLAFRLGIENSGWDTEDVSDDSYVPGEPEE